MWELFLWIYLINATLLINREIDSAYGGESLCGRELMI